MMQSKERGAGGYPADNGAAKAAEQNGESGDLSVRKVQEQVRKMAEECHRENRESVTGIEERKNLNNRACYQNMKEISYTKAHLDQMLDENRYLDFFEKIGDDYVNNSTKIIHELFEDMDGNYSHMLDSMKSMFQSMDDYADGIGNEKFYREYESRRDGLEQKMKQEVQTADLGKGVIMEFAQETKEGVGRTIKKIKPKKRILNILPLLILLSIIVGTSVVKHRNTEDTEVMTEESAGEENKGRAEMIGEVLSRIEEGLEEGQNVMTEVKWIVVQSWSIFLILLIITAYTVYLKFLGKWYRSQICGKCESYLKGELAEFCDRDPLCKKADETIANLVEEYERQYFIILNNIFKGTKYENREADDTLRFEGFIAKNGNS